MVYTLYNVYGIYICIMYMNICTCCMVFSPVVQCTYLTAGGGVAEADGVVEVERVLHRVGGVEVVAGHDARVFWTKDI